MTLVVGIRGKDGVVIGTDSAMTFASDQVLTIEQPLRQKIEIIDCKVIVAGTGEVGLGQRFTDVVKASWYNKYFQDKSVIDIGRMLSKSAIDDFSQTRVQLGSYGALTAVPCRGSAELIEFRSHNFQPEVKTGDVWYVSMGSGQLVADPLLGFMRKTFWGDDPPNRQEAVFAAAMVLELGCEMAPTGVSKPIQIATLGPDKKGHPLARRLTQEELLEHEGNVKGAIEHFGKYQDVLRGINTTQQLPTAPVEPTV